MLKPRSDIKLDARYAGYAYQLDAVEALKNLQYGAVFHEQGLGKTKIGVDLALQWLKENSVDSVIIVTKRGLIENWRDEIKSHTYISPRVLDQRKPSNFFALNSPARVYLTHFEVFKTEEKRLSLFLKTRRVAVILDEAQKIKNPDSAISKSFHRLAPGFVKRIIMTGTPVANRPFDIWSQVFFLDQGNSLGNDFKTFRREYDLSNDLWENTKKRETFEELTSRLFEKISSFSVRETKSSAGIQLPEKLIQNVIVEAEQNQRVLYDKFKDNVRAEVVRAGKVVSDEAEDILKRLLRLVQVASNPRLVDESYSSDPGKFPKLLELVEAARKESSKIIIWTSFVQNADWLAKRLSSYRPAVVHGGRSMEDRNSAVKRFKSDPECNVLLATPGAAKEGLTLTVANHAIFYDRSFSLDDYLQAQDRIHRISQERTCYVWNLICADTVDEWVDALLVAKRLAAQLAQADISREEYGAQATYDFGEIIKQILGVEERHG